MNFKSIIFLLHIISKRNLFCALGAHPLSIDSEIECIEKTRKTILKLANILDQFFLFPPCSLPVGGLWILVSHVVMLRSLSCNQMRASSWFPWRFYPWYSKRALHKEHDPNVLRRAFQLPSRKEISTLLIIYYQGFLNLRCKFLWGYKISEKDRAWDLQLEKAF